jgi:hypothetical protein
MICIKKNIKPDLPICKMVCDAPLHEKLNSYDMTSLMNGHETNLFIGKPKSGKTSLLYSMFKSKKLFRKVFHEIYIFQPETSQASMKDNIFSKLPRDQRFDELTYENLSDVYSKIKNSESKYNKVIIFDDMTAYLKQNDTLSLLKELVFNRRHLRTSIFFLVQTWYSVPKEIRKLFSNIFVFKTSKVEMSEIFSEVVEQNQHLVVPISKLVYDRPYQYLMINTLNNRLFKGFDEIIIDE